MHTLAEMTKDSQNDHGQPCPGCYHSAATAIIAAQLKRNEVDPILRNMAELADKSDSRPDWADVLPFILGSLDTFYQHGDRSHPTLRRIIDRMGLAAHKAE